MRPWSRSSVRFLSVRRADRYGANKSAFTRESLVCTLHGENVNDSKNPLMGKLGRAQRERYVFTAAENVGPMFGFG